MNNDTKDNSNSVLEKTAINMLLQKLDDSLIKSVTGCDAEHGVGVGGASPL